MAKKEPLIVEPAKDIMFSEFNNVNSYKRPYDTLRCIECNGIIKVPVDVEAFMCPNCNAINEFAFEESTQ